MKLRLGLLVALLACAFAFLEIRAQTKTPAKKDVIPHAQTVPPGPALSPADALKKMQVPPGFRVALVAAEPSLVNPVAMTFDEKGRIWITESLEYPRSSAGPGKDRVKVLESTRGDGKFDKVTTVIEGLNIPSGIAVGHGGVWVANAPDILFYPFVDAAEPKLSKPQVVVTGFGRTDTHELPNSLTWGPDGWLYGFNGVFNHSHVKHKDKDFKFTCALFRIHPKTRDFELFCEGTSNPWGLTFNDNGDAFVSACVIDHLWHLTETGYYHRQGGPYPPFTWKIGSIVKHKHQKAAYCGLTWFDSDAYPPEYREKLYMGNIHGSGINVDELTRDGSTYFAKPAFSSSLTSPGQAGPALGVGEGSNFLLANDAWFMPVAQKTGPDGCLYILDWYDRYHCYQDARRDPAGIDRLNGRLYRVEYKDYKPAGKFDLAQEDNDQLIERLGSPNIYLRETAQRVLTERLLANDKKNGKTDLSRQLKEIIHSKTLPRRARLHALWAQIGGNGLRGNEPWDLLRHPDPTFRAWGVRAIGNAGRGSPEACQLVADLARDKSPEVQLQVAIALRKLSNIDPLPGLVDVLAHCGDDKLIPHIVWQNIHPLVEIRSPKFLSLVARYDITKAPGLAKTLPRAIDRILGNASGDPAAVLTFLDKLAMDESSSAAAKLCLTALAVKIQNGEVVGKQLDVMRNQFKPRLQKLANDPKAPLAVDANILLAVMKDADGIAQTRKIFDLGEYGDSTRVRAMNALIAAGDGKHVIDAGAIVLQDKKGSPAFRGQFVAGLAALDDPGVPLNVLRFYDRLEPDLQAKAIELLTQRPAWGKALFLEIAAKKINKEAVNINQVRRLLATRDKDLAQLVAKHWGIPRDSRNPERERIVGQMKELYAKTPGDPKAGVTIFKKLCAQCHKIHGEGVDVGPDITSNGRSDFDQLLSNIFDPSLVIGSGYQAVTVHTRQGQILSGLIVEDNAQRVVLKVQGGELKTIARADVDEQFTSKLSMMPEDLEKQLRPQEIVDLLAYLSLDRPPDDPKARKIPGTPR